MLSISVREIDEVNRLHCWSFHLMYQGGRRLPLAAAAAIGMMQPVELRAEGRIDPHDPHWGALSERSGETLSLQAQHSADIISNVSGGRDRGVTALNNFEIAAEADLESMAGLRGLSLFVYGTYNSGGDVSADRVGDLQGVNNIGVPKDSARLHEAWLQYASDDGRSSLKFGVYDINSEFDYLETANLFIHGAHGMGTDIGQSGRNGPSTFPATGLALRVDQSLAKGWRLRAAVADGVPGNPDHPSRTSIRLRQAEGAFVIAEIEYSDGESRLLAGHWLYTADFALRNGGRADGNTGFYVRGEHWIMHEDGEPDQGLAVFARIGIAHGEYNDVRSFLGAGAVYSGLFESRDADQLGIAVAWAEAARGLRKLDPGVEAREVAFELTYRMPLNDWLTVQPDVQYVVNPGLAPSTSDALLLGVRATLSLGWR